MQTTHSRDSRPTPAHLTVALASAFALLIPVQRPETFLAGSETPCHGQVFCPAGGTNPWLPYGTNPLVPWGTNPPVITYDPNSTSR